MVITCPECSTKFRLNSDRIPDRGAKVRCGRCEHVFRVEKESKETPVEKVIGSQTSEPTPAKEETAGVSFTRETEDMKDRFSQIDDDLSSSETESDFSYDQFRSFDQGPEEETFSFEQETEETPSVEEQMTRGDFSFDSEIDEMKEKSEDSDSGMSDEEIAEIFSAGRDEESIFPESPAPPPAEPAKSSVLGSIIRVLLLLVLGLVVLAGVLYYMNGPEQFEKAIQQLLGQDVEQPTTTGQIALNKLEGKFIENPEAGELFVIQGEAINKYREARAAIQVKGVIFDQNGKSLLQKTIFCGNPITDQELQSLPFAKIEEMMGNQFGKSLSNMNVSVDQAIPFTIVFRDLPKNLAEFSVNIASSKPATQ